MPHRRRTASDWRRIREVFLQRRASYGVEEAGDLLRIPGSTVQAAIEEGTITSLELGTKREIGWEDLVVLGLQHRWTPRMLSVALGEGSGDVLPPLVRVVAGRVVLPLYQWKILRALAAQRSKDEEREITASDLIEEAVSTAVLTGIEDWTRLEALQPGIRAAAEWPSGSDS
jgi:excisionase family DNA binding protein